MPANHGPECEAKTYPIGPCRNCGQNIFFHECSHGSRVILNEGSWEQHRCPRPVPSIEELERLEISYWQI